MKSSISRRDFLKGSLATAGLTIAASFTPLGCRLLSAAEASKATFKPNIWLEIAPDNSITITVPATEMGQGVMTSLPMIVADELDASWKRVRAKHAVGAEEYKNPILGVQLCVASSSVRGYYEPLRKAGAAARMMLIKAAAQAWKVQEKECEAVNGVVRHRKSGRRASYGKLCTRAAKLPVPQEPVLKKKGEFRYIGKSMPRLDIPDKVQGTAVYGIDFTVPHMLPVVFARPPFYGAKPVSFDQPAAERIQGVRKIVPLPMGIAVCADTMSAALRGREELRVKWDRGSHPDMNNASIERAFMEELEKKGAMARKDGDTAQALAGAVKKVDAAYFVPYIAHVPAEPMNCTAHVTKDKCEVWYSTQAPFICKLVASQVSGLPMDKVNINVLLIGGGFGRRAFPDVMVEAILVSKIVGNPVKVVWTREEDIKHDHFRAATAQRVRAGFDGEGRVTAWSHKVVCGSILKDIDAKQIINGVDFMSLWGLADFPGSPHNNTIMYSIPNLDIEFVTNELPVPVTAWRSVQNGPNAFVTECFVDELAHAAGKDPLKFRLELLKDNARPKRVLELAAEKAGWGKPLAKGRGRGIAQHSCFGTYVAQVADITVDEKSGAIRVNKVVTAVDCGPVVNPDIVRTQIEGAIIMSLSATLKEKVVFSNGGVQSENFNDYKIFTMSDVPEIEVHIVDSTDKMGGIGEPGVPPAAPAVANAFFNATGVRIRRLPLDPEAVREAMKKRG
jgi:isoquinoline 1-oxidoreductase subunit beta